MKNNELQVSLCATALSYTYPPSDRAIVHDISYTFSPGNIYSIVGPSGVGKTTFLRLLSGLQAPMKGDVAISSGGDLRTSVSFLQQDDMLLPWRTVEKNILIPLQLEKKLPRKKQHSKVEDALQKFQLLAHRSFFPQELSGGLRRLVSLARAYVEDRPILLLDEPFSSVDVAVRAKLYCLLRDLAQRDGKLIIYVTHDFFDCQALSDRCLFFSQDGTISDIDIAALMAFRKASL